MAKLVVRVDWVYKREWERLGESVLVFGVVPACRLDRGSGIAGTC